MMAQNLEKSKIDIKLDIDRRVEDKIIEKSNADLLKKLIDNAENLTEALSIAELGTTYKRTGLHFDKRLEKFDNAIKYFKKNESLSFPSIKGGNRNAHKLIIGDNYDSLLNLLVQYRGQIDVIYIDPPYGKDSMGAFANTNYENSLTRDNLLSMLYPRLVLARQLLSPESGVIFCSIDDRNQSYVKCLMDEIFGESGFLLNVPRITKKGGKSTQTIAKNNDYILGYTISNEIIFGQEEKNTDKYKYEDEFVDKRGKYALSQTLDYNSLQYSKTMDYPIEMDGRTFYPGGDKKSHEARHAGQHGVTDWVWRWSRSAVKWGIDEKMFVLKNDRIYTKSYLNCRKKNGKNELEWIDATKAYTTLSYLDNKYSNDNGKKELDKIFDDGSTLFKNPKPTSLIMSLIKMVCQNKEAIILDFFAGSGTTGHAVLNLNDEDNGERKFILCTSNEITSTTPNGVVYDVTSKRLKRVMTGTCYDNGVDFGLARKSNKPLGGSLDVYEISHVANFESTQGNSAFDVIDETLYGINKFESVMDKVTWVCENFEGTQKVAESDIDWIKRIGGDK